MKPGRYTIMAKQVISMPMDHLCRANAALKDLHEQRTMLQRQLHDLEYVSVTEEPAFLRYSISVSSDRTTVVVAIFAEVHMETLLDANLERTELGKVNGRVLGLAKLIPYMTILELITGSLPQCFGGDASNETKRETPAETTLLFTGHHFGGSVAHLAATLARQIAMERELKLDVMAVAFSPVSCVNADFAMALGQSPNGKNQVSLYHVGDSRVALMNRCVDIVAALTEAKNQEFNTREMISKVVEHVKSGKGDGKSLFERSEDVVQVTFGTPHLFHPLGQTVFINSDGVLNACSNTEALSKLSVLAEGGPMKPVWSPQIKFSTGASEQWDLQIKPLNFQPFISKAKARKSDTFVEFVIEGACLEPVLRRHEGTCALSGTTSSLLLNFEDFGAGSEAKVFFAECLPSQVKLRVTNLKRGTGRVKVWTDFGVSNEFTVEDCVQVHSDSDAAIANSLVDAPFFQTALLRVLLNAMTETQRGQSVAKVSKGKNHAQYLMELERLLLNNEASNNLGSIMHDYASKKQSSLLFANQAALPTLNLMAQVLAQPVRIETEKRHHLVLRKMFGALGWISSGVIKICAGIALIPAALLVTPFLTIWRNNGNPRTGTIVAAAIPAVLGAVIGVVPGIVYVASERVRQLALHALQDPASRQYAQVLKFLLQLLGVDVNNFLDEIPQLEEHLMMQFSRLHPEMPLSHATKEMVHSVLCRLEEAYHSDKFRVYTTSPTKGQTQMVRWMMIVGRMVGLRRLINSTCVISFMGVHNAGKSTIIEKIFGVKTGGDILVRTEVPMLHNITHHYDNVEKEKDWKERYSMGVDVIDFPGATDERAHIAEMTAKLGHVSSMFVVVFTAGHVAAPEQRVMQTVREMRKPYLVLINKKDVIADELSRREPELRKAYAETLGIREDYIFFVSAKDAGDIEQIRHCIFGVMVNYLDGLKNQEALACALLQKEVREQVEKDRNPAALGVVLALMYEMRSITMAEINRGILSQMASVLEEGGARPQFSVPNVDTLMLLLTFGVPQLAIATVMRMMQPTESRKLQAFVDARPEFGPLLTSRRPSQPMDLSALVATNPDFAHMLANAVQDHLETMRARLQENDIKQEVVEAALEHGCAELQLSLEELLAIAHGVENGTITRIVSIERQNVDRIRHMKRTCTFKPPLPAKEQNPQMEKAKDLPFEHRVLLFQAFAKTFRECGSQRAELVVDPACMLESLLSGLLELSPDELSNGVRIVLAGDDAVDAGGVLVTVFTAVAKELLEGKCEILQLREDQNVMYFSQKCPNRIKTQLLLRAFGRLLGMTALNADKNAALPAKLSETLFKPLIDLDVTWEDLQSLDASQTRSIFQIYCMSDEEIRSLDMNFTTFVDGRGEVPLEPGSEKTKLTPFNLGYYVSKLVKFHLCYNDEYPLGDFVQGFNEVLPREFLQLFTPAMLRILLCGLEEVQVEDILSALVWQGPEGPMREWFTGCVRAMTPTDLTLLLSFVTGLSSVPVGGLDRIGVVVVRRPVDSLPVSHTCFKLLELPPYESENILADKLLFAIRNTSGNYLGMV